MNNKYSKTMAVIVAHPDDETLWTGGTNLNFGFNEWLKAQDGKPMGQDWQTWSAALYLYAANCVEEKTTPFFNDIPGSAVFS